MMCRFPKFISIAVAAIALAVFGVGGRAHLSVASAADGNASAADEKLPIDPKASQIRPGDWNQWGGSPVRNNTPEGKNISTDWKVGDIDEDTGVWKKETSKNIK